METIDYKNFLDVANINNSKNQIKAVVIDVEADSSEALVETIDNSLRIKLNNKTGEVLSIGDYVVVDYNKILTKKTAYISFRNGKSVPATSGTPLTIENAVVIQEKDASYLLHEYTVVDYIAGNKVVYGGIMNPVIINGYQSSKDGDHDICWYDEMTFGKTHYYNYFEDDSKLYYVVKKFNADNSAKITFYFDSSSGRSFVSASYTTKDISATKVKIEYSSITPPNSAFPYGHITGNPYVKYISNSTGETMCEPLGTRTVEIGFASEAEYNAAIGLTYEPQTLSQVNETVTEI